MPSLLASTPELAGCPPRGTSETCTPSRPCSSAKRPRTHWAADQDPWKKTPDRDVISPNRTDDRDAVGDAEVSATAVAANPAPAPAPPPPPAAAIAVVAAVPAALPAISPAVQYGVSKYGTTTVHRHVRRAYEWRTEAAGAALGCSNQPTVALASSRLSGRNAANRNVFETSR